MDKTKEVAVSNTKPTRDNSYDMIRVIATLMIVLHHFYTTAKDCGYKILPLMPLKQTGSGSLNIGAVGVAIFCILSGALLIKRYNEKLQAKEFFKKRVLRVLVPHMICYIFVISLSI